MAEKVRVVQEIAKIIKEKQVGPPGPAAAANNVFDKIVFNRLAGLEVGEGEIAWNLDEDTLDLGQHERVLQLGQELGYFARNGNAGLIANGTPVMATGTIGASGRLLFDLMDGTSSANAKLFLGIATEDFDSGEDGHVTSFGKVRGIDTTGTLSFGGAETWNEGDILYIDPVNVGYLTNVAPFPPALSLAIAFVITVNAQVGVIYVRATTHDDNAVGGGSGGGIEAGATFPTSPVTNDFFWHTLTGREILYRYDGASWTPIISDDTGITVYVDAVSGTDDANLGFGTGANAFASIGFALSLIPTVAGQNVTIFIADGTYNEFLQFFFQSKVGFNFYGTATIESTPTITASGDGFVTCSAESWTIDEHVGKTINIGANQAWIISNTADTLFFADNFAPPAVSTVNITRYPIINTGNSSLGINFSADSITIRDLVITNSRNTGTAVNLRGRSASLLTARVEQLVNGKTFNAYADSVYLNNCSIEMGTSTQAGFWNYSKELRLTYCSFLANTTTGTYFLLNYAVKSAIVLSDCFFQQKGIYLIEPSSVFTDNVRIKDSIVGLGEVSRGSGPHDLSGLSFDTVTTELTLQQFRGALVHRTTAQTIADITIDQVLFPSEDYDTDAFHDTGTNTERLTIPAGVSKVRVSAYINWATSAVGARYARIVHSAGGVGDTTERKTSIDNSETSFSTPVMRVSPGDYFQLNVYQSSGGPLDINSAYLSIEVLE